VTTRGWLRHHQYGPTTSMGWWVLSTLRWASSPVGMATPVRAAWRVWAVTAVPMPAGNPVDTRRWDEGGVQGYGG